MQINSDSTGPSRKNEELLIAIWVLKVVNPGVTLCCWSLPVNSAVLVPSDSQKVVKDVQKPSHLTENEYLAPFSEEFGDEVIEYFELHTCVDDMVSINKWWARFYLVDQIWMIAHLFKLHQHVEQLDSIFGSHAIHRGNIASDNFFVKLLLKLSEADEHINFLLGWKVVFSVHFEPPKHEWLEESVNLLDDLLLLRRVIFLAIF